jgi:hypothetical protein
VLDAERSVAKKTTRSAEDIDKQRVWDEQDGYKKG